MHLRKTIPSALLVLALTLGGCPCNKLGKLVETIKVVGKVPQGAEEYTPAYGGGCSPRHKSKYSFALDTEYGRKSISVGDGSLFWYTPKEDARALVTDGDSVEVRVWKASLNKKVWPVYADWIQVK